MNTKILILDCYLSRIVLCFVYGISFFKNSFYDSFYSLLSFVGIFFQAYLNLFLAFVVLILYSLFIFSFRCILFAFLSCTLLVLLWCDCRSIVRIFPSDIVFQNCVINFSYQQMTLIHTHRKSCDNDNSIRSCYVDSLSCSQNWIKHHIFDESDVRKLVKLHYSRLNNFTTSVRNFYLPSLLLWTERFFSCFGFLPNDWGKYFTSFAIFSFCTVLIIRSSMVVERLNTARSMADWKIWNCTNCIHRFKQKHFPSIITCPR